VTYGSIIIFPKMHGCMLFSSHSVMKACFSCAIGQIQASQEETSLNCNRNACVGFLLYFLNAFLAGCCPEDITPYKTFCNWFINSCNFKTCMYDPNITIDFLFPVCFFFYYQLCKKNFMFTLLLVVP
jgi:hypothetical protein